MADLRTTYLGLELRSPVVASAGPLTGTLATLHQLEQAGVAAVVLPSLFEEEVVTESMHLNDVLDQGADWTPEASSFFPDMDFSDLGPERHVKLVERAKASIGIPVIASVNATSPGVWARYAAMMVDAGADAIELNVYAVPGDPAHDAASVEARYLDAIREVRAEVGVQLAVKLSPYFSSAGHFAMQAVAAGADGLVLFNRFYQPDLDLETLDVLPAVELSQPWELRLPLRWIALIRGHVRDTSLAATSGVYGGTDVAKALLVGADVAMMTSALLRHGPSYAAAVERDLDTWLDEHDYESVAQIRGSMSQAAAPDPEAYERANYIRVLSSLHLP